MADTVVYSYVHTIIHCTSTIYSNLFIVQIRVYKITIYYLKHIEFLNIIISLFWYIIIIIYYFNCLRNKQNSIYLNILKRWFIVSYKFLVKHYMPDVLQIQEIF